MRFTVGNSITATCLLTAGMPGTGTTCPDVPSGPPVDPPGTVYAFSRSPLGVVTQLLVLHPSLGTFTAAFVPNAVGTWIVRFSDSLTPPIGSTFVPESEFVVYPLDY